MKKISASVAMLSLLGGAASTVLAQSYPAKPIRMMIGFPPGGGTDIIGRIVAQKLGDALGQQVIVDNRGGASGQLAAELVSKAAPDGYTIMMAHIAAISILPSLVSQAAVRRAKRFRAGVARRHRPQPARRASVGAGQERQGAHRAGESRGPASCNTHPRAPAPCSISPASFSSCRPRSTCCTCRTKAAGSRSSISIAGQVHMDFDAVPPVINYVRQGKLRALAVTSAKRFSLLPDMPTIEEAGVPGFDMSTWWGIVAPAAVSKDIVNKLNSEMVKSIRQADAKEKISSVGADTVGNSPEEFAAFIRAETEKYARIVKAANIKLD